MSGPAKPILPTRPGETDEEQRLREAINRLSGQFMSALDAAIAMRTAEPEVQRTRHLARGHLQNAAVTAMHTFTLHRYGGDDTQATNPRR